MIPAIKNYEGLDITIQTTEDCPLACKYCYEVGKRPGTLPFDYATKFLDIILTDPDPIGAVGTEMEWILKQGLIIDFIGGDSLVDPEMCDRILRYFQYRAYELNHRWKDRWRCSISTNGVLFGKPGVKEFLMKYKGNISLGVSVDGCPEIHDRNRVFKDGRSTMSEIMKEWDWYLGYAGSLASTKATLNRESIPYIAKSIRYLHEEMRLSQINMNFIFEDMGLLPEDYREIDRQLDEVVDYILSHCDDLHVNMLSKEFGMGKPMDEESRSKGWCGSGAMPCLSINGKIYPCFRFTPNTMTSRELDFHVGDVWKGINHKERFRQVKTQTRDMISPSKCFDCPTESNCAWCIGGAFAEEGKFYRTTNLCEVHKIIDRHSRAYWNAYNSLKGIDERFEMPDYPPITRTIQWECTC